MDSVSQDRLPLLTGKVCGKCHTWKPLTDYHKHTSPDGYRYECKECQRSRRRAYHAEHPEKYRGYYESTGRFHLLKNKYGVDEDFYSAMFEAQGGVCAICGSPPPETRPLHLDHDHTTGEARGLLCARCNTMLTYFGDSAEGLQRVMDYLTRFKA